MNDEFSLIPWKQLFSLTLKGIENKQVFGIPEALFYQPQKTNPLRGRMFDHPLETPVGVSAGPHSQLAQNIISAWLCGARYMELKTVQTLDEIEVSRPCIDMPFEGYNCEWSQELKVAQSFDQYLNAWILIHVLKVKLGWKHDAGTIFNMSLGYDLAGIKKDNVQWFLEKMNDCHQEKQSKLAEIAKIYPRASELEIPDRISDNVTLSTMHGCPPGEIRQIGEYLLKEKGLHTYIKFNPTLLGPETIRHILEKYNYPIRVPDEAFEHDITYNDALEVIESLKKTALHENLHFGLKLTNTLETLNHKDVFDGDSMYMSGKALHPISINVARSLKNEKTVQDVPVSFSGGVDAFNIAQTISAGLSPVTVSTDLLRPGGYGKISQYIENLQEACKKYKANSLSELIKNKAKIEEYSTAALHNLNCYADRVLENPAYQAKIPSIHIERPLHQFDCIQAPCESTCPSGQNVPGYLYHASRGENEKAFEVIMHDNPFPSVAGMICDHECQTRCTRVLYDDTILIREVKRFVAATRKTNGHEAKNRQTNGKVAIIGAGPSGLSCAYYLSLAGFKVEVFESKERAGGMVSATIPTFRLSSQAIQNDIKRIENTGVKIHYGVKISRDKFRELTDRFDWLYLAIGAQHSKALKIEGIEEINNGLVAPLELLEAIKSNRPVDIGTNVIVLGGGNVAVDLARTVKRLVGEKGVVKLAYRRTAGEMPADHEELEEALEEGIEWLELVNPISVETDNGKLMALRFQQMKIEGADDKGRPKPVPDGGKQLTIPCDTIIPAFGQDVEPEFREFTRNRETANGLQDRVFIGGDAARGASTLINAIADGKNTARKIMENAGLQNDLNQRKEVKKDIALPELQYKRARVKQGVSMKKRPAGERNDFKLVNQPLTEEEITEEASRCMFCDEMCSICVDVCPNRANYAYQAEALSAAIPEVSISDGVARLGTRGTFTINQQIQVLNIKDFCNECGNCESFCPSSGAPFRDKPQLHLNKQSYTQAEEAYFFHNGELHFRKAGKEHTLKKENGYYLYETGEISARLRATDMYPEEYSLKHQSVNNINFEEAMRMRVLYSVAESLNPNDIKLT